MFCRNCGIKLPDGVKFCINCGTPVVVPDAPASESPQTQAQAPDPAPAQPAAEKKMQLPTQYRFLNVMGYGDDPYPFVYPSIDLNGNVIWEKADKNIGMPLKSKVTVLYELKKGADKYQTIFRLSDVKVDVYITDARVVLICDQYDKGGTWRGGLSAIALNAIERGVARARTSGKTLVGHIRYEWVKHIMYKRKSGFLSDESILIVYPDRAGNYWQIQMDFPKDVNSASIANDIMHRAATLRTKFDLNGKIPESSLEFYREHSKSDVLISTTTDKNGYSKIMFPEAVLAPGGEGQNPDWKL